MEESSSTIGGKRAHGSSIHLLMQRNRVSIRICKVLAAFGVNVRFIENA
jgi:hypothetical protein